MTYSSRPVQSDTDKKFLPSVTLTVPRKRAKRRKHLICIYIFTELCARLQIVALGLLFVSFGPLRFSLRPAAGDVFFVVFGFRLSLIFGYMISIYIYPEVALRMDPKA